MIGQTVSHYRIVEKLGQGGMGEVFLADDLTLGRKVALKFLPQYLQQDAAARKRFLREARSAAALDHPYICHINEVGESEGKDFIVMEYVEGQTLRDRLERGSLPLKEAVQIATEVAEALEAAHAKGIIHRDLKPSNIMLTRAGHTKVMDFGLAKQLVPPGGIGSQEETVTEMTRKGTTVGTLAYMSPEQLRGEAADARSDIFSFGIVLYEMLAQAHPFKKQTAAETVGAILHTGPQALVELRPDAPVLLQHIVRKMLAKDVHGRYASAHEVRTDLKGLAETTEEMVAAKGKRIVVLPFDDISPGHDSEYFADGLTEEIIGDLSQIRALQVISRTSAMAFKGTRKALSTIAGELNVRYVLEGSVRRAGNTLRISAQLIDAATDAHLWADKYSGSLDDVFDMQEKVSRAIVEALKLKLTAAEERQIARRPITNVQAYDAYLRARNLLWTKEGIKESEQFLQKSLKLTGDNAFLYAGLGYVYCQYAYFGLQQEEAIANAEAYAERALRLDPETVQAHVVLGLVQSLFRGNPQQAVRHFKQALSINPNDWDSIFWLRYIYCVAGKTSTAWPLADRLMEIDPLNPMIPTWRGVVYAWEGRFHQAVELWEQNLALFDVPMLRFSLATCLGGMGQSEKALALLEPIGPTMSSDVWVQLCRLLKLALQGEKEKVPELMSSEFLATTRRDPAYSLWVAECYAILDEREQALDWLENAVNRGFINYPLLSAHSPPPPGSAPTRAFRNSWSA